jgi:hypothetical protein
MENHHGDQCSLVINADKTRLMTRGILTLPGQPEMRCEVQRGMLALTLEGEIAGTVAALAVNMANKLVEFIVLGHLPQATGYQAIPAGQILGVDSQSIWLSIRSDEVAALQVCITE